MMVFYCNGKKGVCDCDILCRDCQHADNSGGRDLPTNAEKIRAMTDEELAKHLNRLTDSYPGVCLELPECHADLDAGRDIPLERCECCWIRWLQQPAEVAG